MTPALPEVYLARHGETEWTISHRHTGRTDVPLTERGERNALSLGERLAGTAFDAVLTSPLSRAAKTCELAGFGTRAELDPDLMEWDYGACEGLRGDEIRLRQPGWDIFRDGCPGGETLDQIAARADRVVARVRALKGRILVFSHSHFLRVMAARWLGKPASDGRYYVLGTASLSIVGYEHHPGEPAIRLWNDDRHVRP